MSKEKLKKFNLPKSIINQLSECSLGFHLVLITSQNEFETHVDYPDSTTELALINYLDIQSTALQERIRMRAMGMDNPEEEDEE